MYSAIGNHFHNILTEELARISSDHIPQQRMTLSTWYIPIYVQTYHLIKTVQRLHSPHVQIHFIQIRKFSVGQW